MNRNHKSTHHRARLGRARLAAGIAVIAAAITSSPSVAPAAPSADGKLRIIAFGAHPDDCELHAAGTAAMWAAAGHHVKFVSVTNGDIGHWNMAGGPLANRRRAEVEKAAQILGIATEVLDIHDGELVATLENRRTITRLIREWRADVVMSHRINDYHPDHRNVGILVMDAAYMVTVPFFSPQTPHLDRNPVFVFYEDGFRRPSPFQPDIVVGVDDVFPRVLDALGALESQKLEGGIHGSAGSVPKDTAAKAARVRAMREAFTRDWAADRFRTQLVDRYGAQKGETMRYAEAFEVSEYGRHPTKTELRDLFP